jgi:transcriptional antiterminator NusG
MASHPHLPGVQNEKTLMRQWYAVQTYSGYEEAVARYLKQRVESLAMGDKIFNVLVPKEKMIKVKGGKRHIVEEKIYPGYVLVEMILTEDSWYVVRNTPRVTGFVGPDNTTPTPLSKDEVDSLLMRSRAMGEGEGEGTRMMIDFAIGDLVKITDGPFKEYDGKIAEVNEEKGSVKVLVPIFGRDTAVELDSLQVKKI